MNEHVENGREGGLTAARRMTKEQRKARACKAAAKRWAGHTKAEAGALGGRRRSQTTTHAQRVEWGRAGGKKGSRIRWAKPRFVKPRLKNPLREPRRDPSPTLNSWRDMLERCCNPKHPAYPRYGGRQPNPVMVCDEWLSLRYGGTPGGFERFQTDMGEKPPGYSIDRIDSAKGYSKPNCQWITRGENTRKAAIEMWRTRARKPPRLKRLRYVWRPSSSSGFTPNPADLHLLTQSFDVVAEMLARRGC